MTADKRDTSLLKHMLSWCDQMEEAHTQYDHSRDAFNNNSAYRNAVAMCLFQICELAGHLSDEFKTQHPELPWHKIRGMRNLFAHDYGNMDLVSIWETVSNDIPTIKEFCKKQL